MAFLSRLASRVALGAVAVVALGFCFGWLYGAQKLGDYLHQPAFNGATLADFCGASEIGGFPFRLKLTCRNLKAPLSGGENPLVFTSDEVKGVANLWSPDHVTLSFSSPAALIDAQGGFAKLRHDGATLDFVWDDARGIVQAEVKGRAIDWRPEVLRAGPAFNVQALWFSAHPASRDGVESLRVEAGADGVTAPVLKSLLGDSAPTGIAVSGDLYPLLPPNDDWRQAVEDWRQAQGKARIDKGEWRWGSVSAQFDGLLGLDETHRLAGKLNVKARGAGPLAARLGLPLAPDAAGALLGAIFGGKPAASPDKPRDDSIALTVNLAQGAAFVGPFRIGTLTPLY